MSQQSRESDLSQSLLDSPKRTRLDEDENDDLSVLEDNDDKDWKAISWVPGLTKGERIKRASVFSIEFYFSRCHKDKIIRKLRARISKPFSKKSCAPFRIVSSNSITLRDGCTENEENLLIE